MGLDFSFKKLMKVGGTAVTGAITIVTGMMFVGYGTGLALGWGHMNALFLGGMLSMSSTTIIFKAFDDMGLRRQKFAGVVLGILVVEDLFAVVLMATGSTLVIDVTPSQKRNQANVCFTWAGIFGMIAGLMGGYHAETLLTFPQLTYCSAFLSVGAILLISMVTVTFRAPLELPLLSFDRFILFRSLGPGLNMMAVPFVLGMILSTIYDSFFYLCIGGGFICFLFLKAATVTRADGRLLVTIGQLLTGAGLLVLYYSDAGIHLWGAGFLIGLGAAASISQFLFVMIQLPLHCERGTGYHTYQLLWELGILLGVMSGKWTAATPSGNPFIVALVVCLVGLIAYQLAVHRYYRKQMERRKI